MRGFCRITVSWLFLVTASFGAPITNWKKMKEEDVCLSEKPIPTNHSLHITVEKKERGFLIIYAPDLGRFITRIDSLHFLPGPIPPIPLAMDNSKTPLKADATKIAIGVSSAAIGGEFAEVSRISTAKDAHRITFKNGWVILLKVVGPGA